MAEMTVERLRQLLDCDPATGIMTWRVASRYKIRAGSVAGCPIKGGYFSIKIDQRPYLRHRLVWLHFKGEWPPGDLDHIDGIPGHDWVDNLRPATRTQNLANALCPSSNTSGFKGVTWDKQYKKWRAQISKDRRKIKIGRFTTAEAAHAAYVAKAKELFGEFAHDGALR